MELEPVVKADIIVTVHFAFVAFVLIGQLLILAGWIAGWQWVRNFSFRLLHLLSILVVAAQAFFGIECPLTTAEREYRRDYAHEVWDFEEWEWRDMYSNEVLRNVDNASPLAQFCNRLLFYSGDHRYFQYGHMAVGALVLITFIFCPPYWPWRKRGAPQQASVNGQLAPGENNALPDRPAYAGGSPGSTA